MLPRIALIIASLAMLLQPFFALAEGNPATNPNIYKQAIHTPVVSSAGMVSTQDKIASQVGAQILAKGGNAVDAAVAVGFALAVVHQSAGNLGGGGFMLVYLAEEDKTIAIDYREVAPLAAHRDMFLDENGNVDTDKARFSFASAGVPGTVLGMYHALTKYGTMKWREVMAPAIKLASQGFPMPYDFASQLVLYKDRLTRHSAAKEVYYDKDNNPIEPGELFVQKDLAKTLRLISFKGPHEFYIGKIANMIVDEMEKNGGIITHEDLANYNVREREVVRGTYRGYEVVSMPPPSSGGLHIIQMLNILEHFDLAAMGAGSADSYHVMTEAMRYAYADRAVHLGDPDFYDVPLKWLLSKEYGAEIAAKIDMKKAMPSSKVSAGTPTPHDSPNTTHYSIADKFGNVVSNTYTLNLSYGSGLMISGAGFLMNDQMDDFSAKPGVMNAYKLIGNEANSIEAGKVPLSSMSPTIVFKDGKPFLLSGGAGGSQIISATLQNIINVIDFDMNIAEAVNAPRIHHQWKPDTLFIQPGISPDTQELLRQRGHELATWSFFGRTASINIADGVFFGVADPRAVGGSAEGAD